MRFLKRTIVSSIITIMVVTLVSACYDTQWALRYFSFAAWAVGFFGMTGGIIHGLFAGRSAEALGCMVGKVALLGALYYVNLVAWPIHDAEGNVPMSVMLAFTVGIGTLFFVLVLRVFGF